MLKRGLRTNFGLGPYKAEMGASFKTIMGSESLLLIFIGILLIRNMNVLVLKSPDLFVDNKIIRIERVMAYGEVTMCL